MAYYKKLTIWENKSRIEILVKFRNAVIQYFNSIEVGSFYEDVRENEKSTQARQEINFILNKAHAAINDADVSTIVFYAPPPAVGGLTGNIDAIANIFHWRYFDLKPNNLIDFIDRAIGVYQEDAFKALMRTLNPFFWIDKILNFFTRIPFKILSSFGFHGTKLENSRIGRVVKALLYLIEVLAAFFAILQTFDLIDDFKRIVGL